MKIKRLLIKSINFDIVESCLMAYNDPGVCEVARGDVLALASPLRHESNHTI